MKEKVCCFCGHRLILGGISDKLNEIIRDLIENKGVTTFYTGHMGDFDELCESAVRRLQDKDNNIKLCWIIPYYSNRLNTQIERYNHMFDEIINPDFGDIHYKKAITLRNRWLVDNSDVMICYVKQDGGAAKTKKYALKKNIEIIDVTTY